MLFWYHKKNTHAIIFFFLIKIRILIESKHNLQSNEHEQKKKKWQHTSTPKQRQSNKPQTDSIPPTPIGANTSLQNIALKPFPCKF